MKDIDLGEMAWQYYEMLEPHSCEVCTGFRNGRALPMNATEERLVTDESDRIIRHLIEGYGITETDSPKAFKVFRARLRQAIFNEQLHFRRWCKHQ